MPNSTFLLIRHGLTDAVGRTLTGTRPGVLLNDVGQRDVARLVERLRRVAITAVASSPLERALETARPIADDHGLRVNVVPDLTEFEVGDWTGATFDALARNDAWRRFNEVRSLASPPRGELMLDVQRRGIAALLALAERHPGGVTAVVSHGDVIRTILLYVLGMPIDFIHRLEIVPAGVSIVEFSDGAPIVRLVNGDTVPARP
jgi:broad specificity phosphatase PhoE